MKNKKIIILVIVILIILIITGIIFFTKQKVKPEEILQQYMSNIENKDYEKMYNMVTTEMSKENYINRNENIYEGIEANNIKISIAKTSKNGNTVEVIYTSTMNTVAGEISFSNTAYLIKENDTYKIKWSSNLIFPSLNNDYKIRVSTIDAKRGEILDRNDNVIAGEQTASQIGLVPGRMNEETKSEDIKNISKLLDISEESINNSLSATYVKSDTFVPLRTVLKNETTLKTSLLQIKGIKIIDVEERVYPLAEASSHLLGYVQPISAEELESKKQLGYTSSSIIGKTGIESIYEERLKATDGAEIYIINQEGDKIKTLVKKEASNGENIKLTIDSNIQKNLYEQFKQDKSASVAINPKTGEILALVSTPTFNSNSFSLGVTSNEWNKLLNDESKPLYNRALASYSPGSSFKPITGAIGLTTKSFSANDNFGTSGTKWQKDSSWKDFYITTLSTYAGEANLKNALIYSDNIYFAKAALEIGGNSFAQNLKNLCFNKEINTPIGNVKSIYSNTDSFSTETQLANSGYGQAEVLTNPIHVAMIYSAFVNDGNIIKTYIEYAKQPTIQYEVNNAFTKEAVDEIKQDLIQVVENPEGTAHSAKINGITIAGKTGTAELKETKEDKEGTEIGWFNAFIADENSEKQLLVISMVEDVKAKGGSHYVVDKVKTIFQ